MKKFFGYILGVLLNLHAITVSAVEKFEVLPDLPDPLAYAVQPANAASVAGATDVSVLGSQSIGNEPSLISVVLSLVFVILLIYITGIIYAKLNKVGFRTLKKQQGSFAKSQVSVVSTTQLGNNKTLHVVELDGKRMLIGASSGAIQLIKDLGSTNVDTNDEEYSHIEIPNIKIPKIEIPKIEIPAINFSKLATKIHKPVELDPEDMAEDIAEDSKEASVSKSQKDFSIEENSDGIIDSLFSQQEEVPQTEENTKKEHMVDPDDYALYKKYLG